MEEQIKEILRKIAVVYSDYPPKMREVLCPRCRGNMIVVINKKVYCTDCFQKQEIKNE